MGPVSEISVEDADTNYTDDDSKVDHGKHQVHCRRYLCIMETASKVTFTPQTYYARICLGSPTLRAYYVRSLNAA